MNIYEYFNSRDVAEHCKKLCHSFTGREMAYMIWQSNRHTLPQKIQAWEELINTMPDEEHVDFEYADGRGLHHFLRKYIARLRQFIEKFQINTDNCVYSYEKLYAEATDKYLDESPLFASYDLCVATAVTEAADTGKILSVRVKKRKVCSNSSKEDNLPMLYLTTKAEPMDVIVAPYRGEEDMLVPPFGFYGMFVELPVPFKRGDVVTGIDLWGQRTDPMVLDHLPDPKGDDFLDMCANMWDINHRGQLQKKEDCSYLSLEYNSDTLTGNKCLLDALHRYLQGALTLDELLRIYGVMILEELSHQIWCNFE